MSADELKIIRVLEDIIDLFNEQGVTPNEGMSICASLKSVVAERQGLNITEAPNCISESGIHKLEPYDCDDASFYRQCSQCFERYALFSETQIKEMGFRIRPKIRPHTHGDTND